MKAVRTILCAACCLAGCVPEARTGMAVRAPDRDELATADRILELTRPGSEHEQLMRLAGTWQVTTTFRSSVPGTDETIRPGGMATNRAILGGRFLHSEIRENWGGQEVAAVVRLGFDRRTGVYTLSRCDTWGTYCVDAEGSEADPGVLLLTGSTADPLARTMEEYRFILDVRSPDRYSVAIDFVLPDGNVLRMVESAFSREGASMIGPSASP